MTCYAVIDTNVLVSALLSGSSSSATVLIIGLMIKGEITPVYSTEIMNEYRDVLARKKFGFPTAAVEYLLDAVEHFGLLVEPSPSGMVLPDMKDLPFYEVVMEKRDDGAYLVTGNLRHYPKETFIVTPRELLDLLASGK